MALGEGTSNPEDIDICLAGLKEAAPDLYLSSLLMPAKARAAVAVLYAFHAEVAGVILGTQEPLVAEIRLRWWADVLEGARPVEASGSPLARALLDMLQTRSLPAAPLIDKCEAHIEETRGPVSDLQALEAHLGRTHSSIFQLAGLACGGEPNSALADASGHTGVAVGTIALLETLALRRSQGAQPLPQQLEADKHSAEAVLQLAAFARHHTERARAARKLLPKPVRAATRPVALVPAYLKRIERHPELAFSGLPPVGQFRRQWALLFAAS